MAKRTNKLPSMLLQAGKIYARRHPIMMGAIGLLFLAGGASATVAVMGCCSDAPAASSGCPGK